MPDSDAGPEVDAADEGVRSSPGVVLLLLLLLEFDDDSDEALL